MKKIIILLVVVGAGVFVWFYTRPLSIKSSDGIKFEYMVKYSGNATKKDRLPILIALSTGGIFTPEVFYNKVLKEITTPMRIILITPPIKHSHGDYWPITTFDLEKYGDALADIVKKLSTEKYQTVDKTILLGHYTGGGMAYYQGYKHGNLYSYIFSVAGYIPEDMFSGDSLYSGTKIYGFHGKNAKILTIEMAKKSIQKLINSGLNIIFKEVDGDLFLWNYTKKEVINMLDTKAGEL